MFHVKQNKDMKKVKVLNNPLNDECFLTENAGKIGEASEPDADGLIEVKFEDGSIDHFWPEELEPVPLMDRSDEAVWLEYANDWLDYRTMAEYYNVEPDLLLAKIDRGRNL